MRIKTMTILLVAILLIIIIIQNTGQVKFTFLFADFFISKLTMLLLISAIAFGLGFMVGRPKKLRRLGDDYDHGGNLNTLSDEDKEYLK